MDAEIDDALRCSECGRCAYKYQADGYRTTAAAALWVCPACYPTYQAPADSPQLGLATTRELLEELQARAKIVALQATTLAERMPWAPACFLGGQVDELLLWLPESILDYRTVDGDE